MTLTPAELPILFQDAMVQAILDGRKTVTRRTSDRWAKVPAGTLLWVREAHVIVDGPCWTSLPRRHEPDGERRVAYYRTGFDRCRPSHRWRPSIHMPRWASRLTLRVVDVRRERAAPEWARYWYRSTDGDIVYVGDSHGFPGWTALPHPFEALPHVDDAEARLEGVADRAAYLALWEAINGPVMPAFVYRVAFEVLR